MGLRWLQSPLIIFSCDRVSFTQNLLISLHKFIRYNSSADAMALSVGAMALQVDVMALLVDAMALQVNAMPLFVETIASAEVNSQKVNSNSQPESQYGSDKHFSLSL
ncbi:MULTISPECIES: hypothetical protein [unclassified Nostoc]|uniref:hypothetical protein n=1 Tax=unclassified Nostoc TaxID=2593658 RepID=UPI002AD42605|nr:hypothetical protein [Nostoc sp. DedQUE03]MDZ7977625.1 hypothetical protein [Nostoc sp. DedQUE03]MDZ8047340.1 hypothetical protein [Nostoc sp. DedQUE02]